MHPGAPQTLSQGFCTGECSYSALSSLGLERGIVTSSACPIRSINLAINWWRGVLPSGSSGWLIALESAS